MVGLRARTWAWRGRAGGSVGGASVTRTLPFGAPGDVKAELSWLVEQAADADLFLGASSSVTPGVPWDNIEALVEGLRHFRRHGRG